MTVTVVLLTMLAGNADQLGPGDHPRTLTVDQWERTYLVHVPPRYDPLKPTPVVFVYHGALNNAEIMVRFCGLNEIADDAGFLVVYPNGTGRRDKALTWNAGHCCG